MLLKKIKVFIETIKRIDRNLEEIKDMLRDTQIRTHDVQDRCYDLLAKSNNFLIRKL